MSDFAKAPFDGHGIRKCRDSPLPQNQLQRPALSVCLDDLTAQESKIKAFGVEKKVFEDQFKAGSIFNEAKPLFKIAENSFKEFVRTGCRSYLLESTMLYKNAYDAYTKSLRVKHPITESTQTQYHHWLDWVRNCWRGYDSSC